MGKKPRLLKIYGYIPQIGKLRSIRARDDTTARRAGATAPRDIRKFSSIAHMMMGATHMALLVLAVAIGRGPPSAEAVRYWKAFTCYPQRNKTTGHQSIHTQLGDAVFAARLSRWEPCRRR